MAKKLSDIIKKIEISELPFYSYLESLLDGKVFTYLTRLSEKSNVYIFSGIIRNFFLGINKVRDIDIVLDKEVNIKSIFKTTDFNVNSFGGYKVEVDGITFDIWYLENTWALRNEPVLGFELEKRIPYTSFFNFSSIVYSFGKKEFYYSIHFVRFLRDKKIDVVYRPNANYSLCVVNTLYYSDKYKLKIEDKLKAYVVSLHKRNENNYELVQLKHFGSVVYKSEEIKSRLYQMELESKSTKTRRGRRIKKNSSSVLVGVSNK